MSLPRLPPKGNILEAKYTAKQMKEYAAKCVALEREACAKLCDRVGYDHEVQQGAELAFDLATAIRARGVNHGQN